MMKFLGAQMVRSMCIITLLLFCGLFGAFYVPTLMTGLNNFNAQNPEDVSFFYPADSGELTKEEIYHIAGDFGVTITAYHELTFLNLIGSSVDRDYDDQGYLIETYMENPDTCSFSVKAPTMPIPGKLSGFSPAPTCCLPIRMPLKQSGHILTTWIRLRI